MQLPAFLLTILLPFCTSWVSEKYTVRLEAVEKVGRLQKELSLNPKLWVWFKVLTLGELTYIS